MLSSNEARKELRSQNKMTDFFMILAWLTRLKLGQDTLFTVSDDIPTRSEVRILTSVWGQARCPRVTNAPHNIEFTG